MATVTPAETYPVNTNIIGPGSSVAKPTNPYSGTFIPTGRNTAGGPTA